MAKRVGVSDLKARLSEYLRLVKKGEEVVVLDRGEPVARLTRHGEEEDLTLIAPATRSWAETLRELRSWKPLVSRAEADAILEQLSRDRRKR